MLNCVIAACSQIGDISRAFETFESFGALGTKPDTDSYNAVICGCVAHNLLDSIPKVAGAARTSPAVHHAAGDT